MNRLEGYRVRYPNTETTALDAEGWALPTLPAGFRPVSTVRRLRITAPRPTGDATGASSAPVAAANPTVSGNVNALTGGAAALNAATLSASATTAPPPPVRLIQSIFSDGLTHVSLFIEPLSARPRRNEKLMSTGATHALSRRVGDWWITAVGDVPTETLQLFVGALERRRS